MKKSLNAIRRDSRDLVFFPNVGEVWHPLVSRIVSVADWSRVSVSERSSPLLRQRLPLSRTCSASNSPRVQLYGPTLGCHQGLTPRSPLSKTSFDGSSTPSSRCQTTPRQTGDPPKSTSQAGETETPTPRTKTTPSRQTSQGDEAILGHRTNQ